MPHLADLAHLDPLAAAGWCLALTFVSAVFPWVNAEIIVASLPLVARSKTMLVGLLLVATVGQMSGKIVVYWRPRVDDVHPARLERTRIARRNG